MNIDELSRSVQVQYMNVKELWQRKGDALDHTLQFRVFETDSATVRFLLPVYHSIINTCSIFCGCKIKLDISHMN